MAADSFRLFPFQEEAAQAMQDAAMAWLAYALKNGPPRYGTVQIPFLGQLKAVTGSGKTPVLAQAVGGLGDAVVLWTTRSSAVVEQTFANLNGRYHPLLPNGVQVLRDIPSQAIWRELIDGETGLTIWVLTVASWNEADADGDGSSDARLRLRREQPDWAGDGSPWEQLRDRLQRPLWVVSDESHNQSAVQHDQLAALRPKGFLMASATPLVNDLFVKWAEAHRLPLGRRGEPGRSARGPGAGPESSRRRRGVGHATCHIRRRTQQPAAGLQRRGAPRHDLEPPPPARSPRRRDRGLHGHQSPAARRRTRQQPEPAGAALSPHHLQSVPAGGWDDPEAYVCYFDGVTRSFVRIRQIVGRVLRQPGARRFESEELNTATLILQTPAAAYEAVVAELRAELRLYAPDDEAAFSAVRLKTPKEPLEPVPVKRNANRHSLPRRALLAPTTAKVEDVPLAVEVRDGGRGVTIRRSRR